ncbi:sensor histidine kinase [Uliginosibacterium sp. sgz301328]|uniref:sensor histidine kinase n=1 Tax=Uliginosibacterium sp. sgz301328 TaxID=3243764 RepID=UPI00359D00F9
MTRLNVRSAAIVAWRWAGWLEHLGAAARAFRPHGEEQVDRIPNDTLKNERSGAEAASIEQTPARPPDRRRCALPDFRNLGSILRVIIVVNVLVALTVLVRVDHFSTLGREALVMAGRIELPLLAGAFLLYWWGTWLIRLTWRELTVMMVCLALLLACVAQFALPSADTATHLRRLLWAVGAALTVVTYFRWRQIEQIPALDEARIAALTARIRPHFFFNSLNGVLGVIRHDPKRAELALESLAELFRELMKDNRDLVTLCDEIELCNRYLELERLRLGDRLQVKWELRQAPLSAKVPPLMLQPLLENAVYHGIEPSPEPGTILVRVVRKGNALEIFMSNPAHSLGRRTAGNRMAMNNIRERLDLFFDMEAALTTEERDGQFRVRIRMPLRQEVK